MTGTDANDTAAGVPADPAQSIRALAAEHAALVRRLRGAQIPQHVGMATACRALAVELPRALAAQVDADLRSGVLAKRWAAVRAAAAEPGASGELDATLTALALLLREQGRAAMRHLLLCEKEWAADAYRLEGQAGALEATIERLQRVAADTVGAAGGAETGR
jgi:predicted ArsR family transcriptional regulator